MHSPTVLFYMGVKLGLSH